MIPTVKTLDDTDKKIVKLLSDGLTIKEIAYQENIKSRTIAYRIHEMKSYFKCKSTVQLCSHLHITAIGNR